MKDLLEKITDYGLELGAEYCEVRVSKLLRNLVQVNNAAVSRIEPSASSSASVRILDGAWGFAVVNEINEQELKRAAVQASKLARINYQLTNEKIEIVRMPSAISSSFSAPSSMVDPREGSLEEIEEIIIEAAKAGLSVDPRISTVLIQCVNDLNLNYFSNSEGSWIESFCPTTILYSNAVAKEGAKVKRKWNRIIVSSSSEVLAYSDPISFTKKIAKDAIGVLSAKEHLRGKMPLIVDNILAGTMCTAMSDNLRAYNILSQDLSSNPFVDKVDQQVGSEAITLTSEPNLEGMPVFYEYDVEGVPVSPTILIEKGILKGFIHDRSTAAIMNTKPTGCSRAVSAARSPVAELSNVILKAGDHSLPELLEGISKGVYATGLAGADAPVGTKCMITSESGFLIENGELADQVDQISFSFDFAEDLDKIDAIGNDFSPSALDKYMGAYYALIGTGSPHVRFSSLEIK